MMMKIFGAVLIVSGGYLLGKVRTSQWERRLRLLLMARALFEDYRRDLCEYRRPLADCFCGKGELADKILAGEPIKGLLNEDQMKIQAVVRQLKNSSFQQSIDAVRVFLNELDGTIKKIQEDTASQGKALPLVTGAIGLLIAVLLF